MKSTNRFLTTIVCLFLATGIHASVAEKNYTEADDGVKPDKEVWGKLEERLYAREHGLERHSRGSKSAASA